MNSARTGRTWEISDAVGAAMEDAVRTWLAENPVPQTYSVMDNKFLHAVESIFWEMAGWPAGLLVYEERNRLYRMIRNPPPKGTPVVYRHFGAEDDLLYIGSTIDLVGRNTEHRRSARWWDQVIRITWEARPDFRNAEAAAIAGEHPRFNVQGRAL